MAYPEPHCQLAERQPRIKKFTEANIRQIINLVDRGTSPADIAEIIGVSLGTLRTTCSKLRISLRRPKIDNGIRLLRHRPAGQSSAPTSMVIHTDASKTLIPIERNPMEDELGDSAVNGKKSEELVTAPTNSNAERTATMAVVMRYKGQTHTADLPLSHELIAHLAIEAGFRGISLVHLIAQTIESIVRKDHFDLLLGQIPKTRQFDGHHHLGTLTKEPSYPARFAALAEVSS